MKLLVIIFTLSATSYAGDVVAHRHIPQNQSTYERAVNTTLDAVMWIHDQHSGRMTWQELNTEVCRQMKVKRTEPWERH